MTRFSFPEKGCASSSEISMTLKWVKGFFNISEKLQAYLHDRINVLD